MLIVNLVNVIGLMSDDTSCDPPDCGSTYQDHILPVLDWMASLLFTIDMINSMIVLGFASYFDDAFNKLDFFVVLTGWLDVAELGMDFSALRALRVLRPMRLVKYFKGIQAIIGAIYFNLEPIGNVIQFMLFFLIIFGIAGITLFPGKLQHRCVVDSAYPSQTVGIDYGEDYAAAEDVGEFGEFEYFCTPSTERQSYPFPYRCASYMTCDSKFGNPHFGATNFDNFGGCFLLMFQVQTLSTWYEFDYWTEMTVTWYSTIYYQMILFLIGFIVSQLFIAVVCFGFESLEEQLDEPVFSDAVIGLPYVEQETEQEDNLCKCLNAPLDPLAGAKKLDMDRGKRDGIRIMVKFLYHNYAPIPLDKDGKYEDKDMLSVEANAINETIPAGKAVGIDPNLPQTAWSDGNEITDTIIKLTPEQEYAQYRELMQSWKDENSARLKVEKEAPFCMAHGSEEPKDIEFRFDALKAWSNERVFSLEVMLRAQEEMDELNIIRFFHDLDGMPGREMGNEILADLVEIENDFDMPELIIHARSYIKVTIEPLTAPWCDVPEFSLEGCETIGEVKKLAYDQMKAQDNVLDPSVELSHCQMYVGGDTLVKDDDSLWQVCLEQNDAFDPMLDGFFFAITIDSPEAFVLSSLFDNTVIAVICINSVFLSADHYGKSEFFTSFLEIFEWIFNVAFTIEMFIKFYCLKGFGNYWRFGSNKFDFMIVCSSWLNILTESIGLDLAFMKVLRIFRALRVTRVLRKIPSVRTIIDAAFNSMQPIINILMFMIVVLVVYSCMGMQLYGDQFKFGDSPDEIEIPRENFDNFIMAFISLFQVLTGSAWELVLYDCMRANKNDYLGVPFILSFFVLSNYIILNLFIGAILANMGTGDDDQRLCQTHKKKNAEIKEQLSARESQLFVNNCLSHAKAAETNGKKDLTSLQDVMLQPCAKETFINSPIEGKRFGLEISNCSLCMFSSQSRFRRSIYNLVKNEYFDWFILLVIVYSTCLLTMLNPDTVSDEAWTNFFRINDIIFLTIFTVEFCLKIIAFGFIWSDNIEFMLSNDTDLKELMLGNTGVASYMYDSWNYLDLVVLVVSYVNMFGDPEGPLKILRLLRAFRPLRMVNRIDGMKLVIMSLVDAAEPLANVCVLLFAVFLIFGILGLSLFSGKFQACNDAADEFIGGSNKDNCYGHATEDDGHDFWAPKRWANPALDGFGICSFDNIWYAFMALFEVASGDSWETVMYLMADVPTEAGQPPYRDDGPMSNCLWAFFCVIFVFMGQLFMMQLFVSVIIDSFSMTEGSGLLTGDQLLVNDMTKYFTQLTPEAKPEVPGGWRNYFYFFFTNVKPLPVPEVQQCIDANHLPKNRFVADVLSVRRQIEVTKQSLLTQTDPLIVDKMDKAVKFLQESYEEKMEDIRVFEQFGRDRLENQQLPDGILYIIGTHFDTVLTVCIMTNIAFMCTLHHEQTDEWEAFLWYQNLIFLIIFTVEMTIKHIGLGLITYWTSPFDAFDGFTIFMGWFFVFVDAGAIGGIVRIGRVFRLVKRARKLQNLMSTLVQTLPSITNVFMVLLLVFFIFAVIGVELFGKTRYGFSLNVVANMGNWSAAMHCLWRAALGNWRGIMYDAMVMGPDCTMTMGTSSELPDGSKYNDCGDYITSCLYFVLFQVVATFCVLNLVVAIILNAFTWCYSLEPSEITEGLSVNGEHLLHFKQIWDRFDLFGTGFINIDQLQFFMSVVQFQIKELCATGEMSQQDEAMYSDFSSFGSGPGGTDRDASEALSRANYLELVDKLTKYERALDVTNRIYEEGISIQKGENTFIFNAKIENGVVFVPENGGEEEAELVKVRYSSLITILVLEAVGLDEHDQYVCHNYREPYKYRIPGYREDDIVDGRITTAGEVADDDKALLAGETLLELAPKPDVSPSETIKDRAAGVLPRKDIPSPSPLATSKVEQSMKVDKNPTLPSLRVVPSAPPMNHSASRSPSASIDHEAASLPTMGLSFDDPPVVNEEPLSEEYQAWLDLSRLYDFCDFPNCCGHELIGCMCCQV